MEMKDLPIVNQNVKSEAEEKYWREMGEYRFHNNKNPGVSIKFNYGSLRGMMTFVLKEGESNLLPRHVAEWINSKVIPIYRYEPTHSQDGYQYKPVLDHLEHSCSVTLINRPQNKKTSASSIVADK